jgi:hypothetical protein
VSAPASRLEAIVGTSEAVVLCGSGISAVPPSSVPTWYGLNAAALDGLRRLALEKVLTNPVNRTAVLSLQADDVPISTFSQVLSDGFAGRGWLDILTVLDGDIVNAVHKALAALISGHRCRAIITTNFDTLIERACRESGFKIPVVLPALPPDASLPDLSQPALYKIHGTVNHPSTMVDLLLDKGSGLSPTTRRLIAAICQGRHLVVMGFSGADFAMDPDYLGLLYSAALPARVTWIVRPASDLHEAARAFLNALSARGVSVAIESHELLDLVEATAGGSPPPMADAGPRLEAHVWNWLTGRPTFPPTAALVLAEILRVRGHAEAAAAVRGEIRDFLTYAKSDLLSVAAAPAAWALLGKEERDGDLALGDLRRAEQAMDRFDEFVAERKIVLRWQADEEQRLLHAAIRQNAAVMYLRAVDLDAVSRSLASAEKLLEGVQGPEAGRRLGGIYYQRALLNLVQNQVPRAMVALELSIRFADRCGDVELQLGSISMLAACLRACGDWELAELLGKRATTLAKTATDAEWRALAENAARQGGSLLASGTFNDIVRAIDPQPPWDELPAARAAGNRERVVNALVANVERDLTEHGGARAGQTLLSLALATEDTSPASRYVHTVRTACSADLPKVRDHIRFFLRVTELGINVADGEKPSAGLIDELQKLGRPFDYESPVFAPQEFSIGLRTLAYAAAQAGVEAFEQADFERAEGLYYLGYRGLEMESEYENAARAELFRFDALFALERYAEAAECLDGIRDFASRHLPIRYLPRQLAFLCWRALHKDPANWPTEANAMADLARSAARQSPADSNRAMITSAINVARLKQTDLAKELIQAIDDSTLSDDDAKLLNQARALIKKASEPASPGP